MNGFKILNKIGEGSFSTVLKVQRKKDGIIYALKKVKFSKLNEKEKSNALNEIRILASINNKNIISYKEAFFDENDSSLDIVMEYADKGDLFQLITEHKKTKIHFNEDEIWNTLIQLLNGLKSLHALNILHRDLKSANVFLFKGGIVKIGDLNVSKVTRKGMGYTQTGTPYYASPEVWKDKPYNSKSDIWSLGCVIYEMCALNPPFKAQNMEDLFKKVIRGYYPDISNKYSKDLSEIIKLMIQIEVGARPSCDELLNMPIIKKRIEFFKNKNKDLKEIKEENNIPNNQLLSTIRLPKNINNLSRNLPKPNYLSNSFDINSFNNNDESKINSYNNILNINKNKVNIKKGINNINSLNKNLIMKYKMNNKLEEIFLKNNNFEKPLNIGVNSSHINKRIDYCKKNVVFSPMGRIQNKKDNKYLGKRIILPELKLKNKNLNLLRNLSIVNNNNIIKDSNRLIKKSLSINKSYKNMNIKDNDNYEKSDNCNIQNLKVVNLNIIEPKRLNNKRLFRIGSSISINKKYNDKEKKMLNNNNDYSYFNNKIGSPKKNIILNINL